LTQKQKQKLQRNSRIQKARGDPFATLTNNSLPNKCKPIAMAFFLLIRSQTR